MPALSFCSVALGLLLATFGVRSDEMRSYSGDYTQHRTLPFFSPCTFPVQASNDTLQTRESRRVCNFRRSLPFVCDLHFLLSQQNVQPLARAYETHRSVFEDEHGRSLLQIVLVRQLAAPSPRHVALIDAEDVEFGCLFRTPSLFVTREIIEKLAHSYKTFTKTYTAALFNRWFPPDENCKRPRMLALVVLDGLLTDPRKLTSVNIHTDSAEFALLTANIQLEAANALLQGSPPSNEHSSADRTVFQELHWKDNATLVAPHWRRHGGIPMWACELAAISVLLVIVALIVEWYIVRRSVAVKRSAPQQETAIRSKTHLIF
ncbi:hypothetical protein M3Y99_00067600 [Aphelenchoides fujianensis]|nr:hypothetical protein M3Y99_00067600 [Aphelenchoides fujianensis]